MNNRPPDCLIVAATAMEIAPFLEQYRSSDRWIHVNILITGVGLTAATYSILKQVMLVKPSFIIQAGIAGSFDERIAIGTVVAVKKDIIGDEGVIEKKQWKSMADLGFVNKNNYPFSNGWLENKSTVISKLKLKKVKAVTINQISSGTSAIKMIKNYFNPQIESMEGAALHYVALKEKIPFVQLRAISNYAGDRNKKNWNIKESVTNLNIELIRLLSIL